MLALNKWVVRSCILFLAVVALNEAAVSHSPELMEEGRQVRAEAARLLEVFRKLPGGGGKIEEKCTKLQREIIKAQKNGAHSELINELERQQSELQSRLNSFMLAKSIRAFFDGFLEKKLGQTQLESLRRSIVKNAIHAGLLDENERVIRPERHALMDLFYCTGQAIEVSRNILA